MKMENRKGISHIEIILSFVIFAGFLIFLLAIFNPFRSYNPSSVYLNILERGIINNISSKVDFFTLRLNKNIPNCFYFSYDMGLKNVSAKDKDYNKVEAKSILAGDKKQITVNGVGDFYYIYGYEGFEEDNINQVCKELKKVDDYTIGLSRTYDMVSFTKLLAFQERYNSDYTGLKKELETTQDFSFNVKDSLGNVSLSVTKNVPKTNVFSMNAPIQIVYNNGSFKYAILNIQTW